MAEIPNDDEGAALPPPPPAGEEEEEEEAPASTARTKHARKAYRRAKQARTREAHDLARTRELRALLDVLQAVQSAVPALARAPGALRAIDPCPKDDSLQAAADGAARPSRRRTAASEPLDEREVEAALAATEAVFRGAAQAYSTLREAYGPADGIALLGSMIDRPPKYQEKFLAQELSLLAKVWAFAGGAAGEAAGLGTASAAEAGKRASTGHVAIVDIGAGNGCLALLAAMVLGGHAVLIDHTLPPQELRVEDKVPEPYRSRVLRITGDVADLDVERDVVLPMQKHGVQRAVVVAKHLCGVGTDLALGLVRRWRSCAAGVELLGAVLATCCGHKIGAADRETFAVLHEDDTYLNGLTGGDAMRVRQLLALSTRCVAWRTTAGALGSRITLPQVRAAELFEDALQQPRLNLLRKLFPAVAEVTFVPPERSPQNRCLLAGSPEGLRIASAGAGEEAAAEAALLEEIRAARTALLAATGGGPLDLRPHGFVSAKYDYDGA